MFVFLLGMSQEGVCWVRERLHGQLWSVLSSIQANVAKSALPAVSKGSRCPVVCPALGMVGLFHFSQAGGNVAVSHGGFDLHLLHGQ